MIIKKIQIKLFILFFLFSCTLKMDGYSLKYVECLLFGSVPAQQEQKEPFDAAKEFFDIEKDYDVFYARWPWNYYSSFTAFSGTWIDETVWQELDLREAIFSAYHEVAHVFSVHAFKKVVLVCLVAALSGILANKYVSKKIVKKLFSNQSRDAITFKKQLVTATISLLSSLLAAVWYTRQSEQEADEQAIYALCVEERQDIVEYEIEQLEDELENCGDSYSIWFGSLSNKINYFKRALIENY